MTTDTLLPTPQAATEYYESQVTDLLANLGSTPEQVAASLRERGVKGFRHAAGSCPIANYLHGSIMFHHEYVSVYLSTKIRVDADTMVDLETP